MDKMTFANNNQIILDNWLHEYEKVGISSEQFAPDGIMFRGKPVYQYFEEDPSSSHWIQEEAGNESELWANAPLRILYLTKDQPSKYCGAWDVREECYHHPNSEIEEYRLRRQYKFHRMLTYSLYGLVHCSKDSYPTYKEVCNKNFEHELLNTADNYPYARINCKKTIGDPTCPEKVLKEYLVKDSKYLLDQISSLQADVIVCCGNQNEHNSILEMLNSSGYEFKWTSNKSYSVHYDSNKNIVAIDSYHLSSRVSEETLYKDIVICYHNFLKEHPEFYPRR